ncbi:hypothetical protein CASFOL_006208 [Castilleja foliolosa]|uniref:non-specific serine/threonine protein kinase n=1 Tax=Castilleja foliolosa TaxID=1961234 RepID=A0ABD3E5N4_9LAMI
MERNITFLQSILVVLLAHYQIAMSSTTNITTDKFALLTLKSQLLLSPSDILFNNWTSNSASICNWVGVTCSYQSPPQPERVTSLDLSMMGLNGILVPDLGNLTFLVSLKLNGNRFHGIVPPELVQLQQLKDVNLSFNSFSGEIPPWFGSLPHLQYLRLRNNHFIGPIPPSLSLASQLKTLDLSFNLLNGSVPFTLFNMSNMEYLRLSNNYLSGNLPADICRNLPSLIWLGLPWNQLNGQIPSNISQCSRLKGLNLAFNKFSGPIPRDVGKLRMIEGIYIDANNLTGAIPEELGNLTTLQVLTMAQNQLEGIIPSQFFNISSLQYLDGYNNHLSGMLPDDMCTHLKRLETLILKQNEITGYIPTRLYECSELRGIDLSSNKLNGSIPPDIGNSTLLRHVSFSFNNLYGSIPHSLTNISTLRVIKISTNQLTGNLAWDFGYGLPNLVVLRLDGNYLTSEPSELSSFITSLTNCRNLNKLALSGNALNGMLPESVGNLSTLLDDFHLASCKLKGRVPKGIGNLSQLISLDLSGNQLTGALPNTVGNMNSLQGLFVSGNIISGPIPATVCTLPKLYALGLGNNLITGAVPACIGNITTLYKLFLDSNKLNGNIPEGLWSLTDLHVLNLSKNSFVGHLSPGMGNLMAAVEIHLSMNLFSGVIPRTIGHLLNLETLKLAHNELQGSIPETIANMTNLQVLDLSYNGLTGTIPKSVKNLHSLGSLNVSFNGLNGQIPFNATFKNITFESFLSNKGLCGDSQYHVPPCKVEKPKTKVRVLIISLGPFSSVIIVVILVFVGITKKGRKSKASVIPELLHSLLGGARFRVSYYEILEATQGCNRDNLLGRGSFGSVYRGTLKNGVNVAVKVFNLQLENASKSFEVECEVLRNLRHRNLCKVVGCCSNQDFKALVLEYMPCGSLEQWLYSPNHFLDASQRISIMIDVACALEYLHQGYSSPVIHCDLKPSNILLDQDLNAHLCDFGVAKLLGDGESIVQTMTLATLSYIAPEYGTGGFVSVKCDVYSYGIILLEVFTRRRPTDEIFTGNMGLRSWVNSSMPNALSDVIDPSLLMMSPADEDQGSNQIFDCLSTVMELGLNCSVESPRERMKIKDVIAALNKIKLKLRTIGSYDDI